MPCMGSPGFRRGSTRSISVRAVWIARRRSAGVTGAAAARGASVAPRMLAASATSGSLAACPAGTRLVRLTTSATSGKARSRTISASASSGEATNTSAV